MENGPIKSSIELSEEKRKKEKEEEIRIKEEKEKIPLRSAMEIGMEGGSEKKKEFFEQVQRERAETMLAEAESKNKDREELEKLGKELGIDVSQSIEKISIETDQLKAKAEEQIAMEKTVGKEGVEVPEITDNYREITKEEIEAEDKKIREESIVEKESEIENEKKDETNIAENEPALPKEEESSFEAAQKERIRKADEAIADEFSKEETTAMHTDDSKKKEIDTEIKTEIKREKPDNIIDFTKKREEKMAAKAETGEYQGPASPAERAQIRKEALADFRRGLKGKEKVEKSKKWEGDIIMQAMEDFINQQQEKSSVTKAFKNMASFIRKRGTEINSGKIAVHKAVEEFTKKSSEWAAKIFGEKKSRKSDEALRIDEIMSGGKRSAEAIRVDESIGKAFEARGEDPIVVMEKKLGEANNMDELIHALDRIETVTGEDGKIYQAEKQREFINKLFTGDSRNLSHLASGPIKDNAQRVYFELLNKSKSPEEQKAA